MFTRILSANEKRRIPSVLLATMFNFTQPRSASTSSTHKQTYWTMNIAVEASPKTEKTFRGLDGGHDCGEDAFMVASNLGLVVNKSEDGIDDKENIKVSGQIVVAIADGVGGWRKKGIDPSVFSKSLMKHCACVVQGFDPDECCEQSGVETEIGFGEKKQKRGFFANLVQKLKMESEIKQNSTNASVQEKSTREIVNDAFSRLVESFRVGKEKPFGSSTLALASLSTTKGILSTVNLGDSGYILLRRSAAPSSIDASSPSQKQYTIVEKSQKQQSRFNAPYQLTFAPGGHPKNTLSKASYKEDIHVRDGDILVMATDGLWDNLWEDDVVECVNSYARYHYTSKDKTNPSINDLMQQEIAKELVLKAKTLSAQEDWDSPFAREAAKNNVEFYGGKEDDITVAVAMITEHSL